jgi:hypothetical protein
VDKIFSSANRDGVFASRFNCLAVTPPGRQAEFVHKRREGRFLAGNFSIPARRRPKIATIVESSIIWAGAPHPTPPTIEHFHAEVDRTEFYDAVAP